MLAYPFAGAGATNTDALYAIGTADALLHVLAKPTKTAGETLCYLMNADDATNIRLGIRYTDDKPFIEIGAATYVSSAAISVSPWGRVVDLWAMLDRSGSCYFYADGVACGSIDISADVGTDIDSDTIEIGGRLVATEGWSGVVMQAHEHVLAGTFPTADERAAIAMQRFLNPDAESPVLAARAAYATERRLDVDFVDTFYNATTVANHGTGGDLTIGGGLQFRDCRTRAERSAISIPDDSWYCLDQSHDASVTANLGCSAGTYIIETIYKEIIVPGNSSQLFEIRNATGNDQCRLNINGSGDYLVQLRMNGTYKTLYLFNQGNPEYGRGGLNVLHQVFAADVVDYYVYLNAQQFGQKLANPDDLDLSGNVTVDFGDPSWVDGIIAIRVWNTAGGSSSLPAGWADEIRDRVINPWETSGAFAGMTLRGNWELRDGAQLSGSTTITNLANPGTCDLTVSGGSTFGDARIVKLRGL